MTGEANNIEKSERKKIEGKWKEIFILTKIKQCMNGTGERERESERTYCERRENCGKDVKRKEENGRSRMRMHSVEIIQVDLVVVVVCLYSNT